MLTPPPGSARPPTNLRSTIETSPRRLVMPIGAYAGLALTGGSVRDVVSNPDAQAAAVLALHERLRTPFLLTAMDLSAEAEAFGSAVRLTEGEIPAVLGRLVTDRRGADRLAVPAVGEARTRVHLDAAAALVAAARGTPVLGGLIGPFSLAARLFGVAEALEATLSEPATILALLEAATSFLTEYALAFRETGASGVVIAEPAAGLLSPRSLARFSAPFVRRIAEASQDESFAIVLHNCGARNVHLARVLESGAAIYHFGAPMDLPAALAEVEGRAILCGNVDPTFIHGGPAEAVRVEAARLVAAASGNPAFVLSSGCDLPPGTPLEHVEALLAAADEAVEAAGAVGAA